MTHEVVLHRAAVRTHWEVVLNIEYSGAAKCSCMMIRNFYTLQTKVQQQVVLSIYQTAFLFLCNILSLQVGIIFFNVNFLTVKETILSSILKGGYSLVVSVRQQCHTAQWSGPLPREVFCNSCLSHTNLSYGKSGFLLKAFPMFQCILLFLFFIFGRSSSNWQDESKE